MSAETVAYAALTASPGLTNLVGTRVYPDMVPREQGMPSVAMSRIESEYVNSIHTGVPLATLVTLEIWCMGDSRASAEEVADAAVLLLANAGFFSEDRRQELDAGPPEIFAAILVMKYWE